ncbi:MAG: T9SS type A sorting domain-containing protein [Bacteroidota bacterium]
MDVGSEDTNIWGNEIVDVTDVAIGLFRSQPSGNTTIGTLGSQHSQIHENKILNAGNSATGAIAIDPGTTQYDPNGETIFDYSGTNIYNNTIWTSNSAHNDVPIQVGTRWEYHSNTLYFPVVDDGVNISNNILGSSSSSGNIINANIGILVDGSINVAMTNNSINSHIEAYHSRPTGVFIVNSDPAYTSGSFGTSSYTQLSSLLLNTSGHTGGVYISGPDQASALGTATFSTSFIADYLISNYEWKLCYSDTFYNNNVDDPVVIAYYPNSTSTITINFAQFPQLRSEEYFRLQLIVGPNNGQWLNDASKVKYIKNSLLAKKSSDMNSSIPSTYELKQNYPNPFNPTTTISYSLKEKGLVQLNVYNVLGQKVAELVNQRQEAGNHSVTFNGSGLPSGIYIYRIQSSEFSDSKKFILMK